jgi:hypothetical protein
MGRLHIPFAVIMLLSSAPLLGARSAAAEPAGMPDRPTAVEPEPASPVYRTTDPGSSPALARTGITPVPRVDFPAPVTPVPLNLPDDATASEVRGEYGIGIATLILGTVLIAFLVSGTLYFITRRNWSTQHRRV